MSHRGSIRVWVTALTLLSLMLASVSVAQATTTAKIHAAGERMRGLGLAKGVDASGDLALDASITRAQLVTILVRAFGKEEDSKKLQGSRAFPDTANHPWASGYIAMAKAVIEQRSNGRETVGLPDGTFNPEGNVTSAETIAFLMKFLGTPKDGSKNWPENYLQGALKAGLIDAEDYANLNDIKNAPATRGLVFYLSDRAFYGYKLPEGGTVYTTYVNAKPPVLTLDTPTTISTTEDHVTISGKVEGATLVTVGDPTNVATIASGSFTITLPVHLGSTELTVRAFSQAGAEATARVTIKRTASAPVAAPSVYIELPEPFSVFMAPHVEVSGTYVAPAGVHSIVVNGVLAEASNGKFHAKVNLREEGLIEATITDHTGQTAHDSIMLTPGPHLNTIEVTADKGSIRPNETVRVTFILKDAFRRPVMAGGHQIEWYSSIGTTGYATDNHDGTYTAELMPHGTGTIYIYGRLNGLEILSFAAITVTE